MRILGIVVLCAALGGCAAIDPIIWISDHRPGRCNTHGDR